MPFKTILEKEHTTNGHVHIKTESLKKLVAKNDLINNIIKDFSKFPQVEAIAIAGSIASGTDDINSDIDLDIYTNGEVPPLQRKKIAEKYSNSMEIDNQFWGPGDEWIIKNSSTEVDIVYFDVNWIYDYFKNTIDNSNAWVGYTTCFWHNVLNAKIIFDRNNKLSSLQEKYNINYPSKLKQNIVNKNYPILRDNFSSYYHQIEKALLRDDLISVNHRVAAMFASYFDIIFAINEMPHPGEKKLMRIIKNKCTKLPSNWDQNVNTILNMSGELNKNILSEIDSLTKNLTILLKNEHLL